MVEVEHRRSRCAAGIELLESRKLLSVNIELLADINPTGSSVAASLEFVAYRDELYFSADDGIHGLELWKTDGTEEGTVLVADINEGVAGSRPTELTVFDDQLFFAASDGLFGDELWKTDGTASGTVRVADLNPEEADAFPSDLVEWNGELFFSAEDMEGGQLWKSDGSEVFLVSPFGVFNSFPDHLFVFRDELYFSASEGIRGDELWKSDGTDEGTILVADIFPGSQGSFPQNFLSHNNELYFIAGDMVDVTGEILFPHLFKTDGTELGTLRVADQFPVRDITTGQWSITEFDGDLFFTGNDLEQGVELFRTNGTPGNTMLVRNLNGSDHSIPLGLTRFQGELYFSATDAGDREVWRTDGTEAGTRLFQDVRQGSVGSFPIAYREFGDLLFFVADDGTGYELWSTDGSEAASRLTDLNIRGDSLAEGRSFATLGDQLFFRGTDGETGFELWVVEQGQKALAGDLDGDGRVQFSDFLILSSNFGKVAAGPHEGDIDNDGTVQFPDFLLLSSNFGRSLGYASLSVGQSARLGAELETWRRSTDHVFDGWSEVLFMDLSDGSYQPLASNWRLSPS